MPVCICSPMRSTGGRPLPTKGTMRRHDCSTAPNTEICFYDLDLGEMTCQGCLHPHRLDPHQAPRPWAALLATVPSGGGGIRTRGTDD